MKHITEKLLFCFLACLVCLCAYGTETNNRYKTQQEEKSSVGHNKQSNQTKLYGNQNNYDCQNGLEADETTKDSTSAKRQDSIDTLATTHSEYEERYVNNQIESSKSTGLSLFDYSCIIALILSVVSLLIACKKNKQNYDDKNFERQLRDMNGRIENQDAFLINIQRDIKELKAANTKVDIHSKSQNIIENNIHISASPKTQKNIRYATTIKGNLFPSMGLKEISDDFTVCILTLTGDYGTFVVNSAKEVQQKILSQFNYGLSGIVNVKAKSASPKAVKTLKVGKLKKIDNDWQITEKADVELC